MEKLSDRWFGNTAFPGMERCDKCLKSYPEKDVILIGGGVSHVLYCPECYKKECKKIANSEIYKLLNGGHNA